MDWMWVVGIVVVMIVAALVWWLFSRNSRSTDAGAAAQAPSNLTRGPSDGGAEAAAVSAPPAQGVQTPAGTAPASQPPPSHPSDPPADPADAARGQERQARDTDADRPLGDSSTRQEHVADAMYEEEVYTAATDEDMVVEETMPESPGATGTTTAQGAGTEEPPPADVEDAAAEQSPRTAQPLYDETEWLGYAGEAVIEPSVAAENGDGPDRRRG